MVRITRLLAVITSIGMFLVLVAGTTVTNTGSEHGCGKSWPLCHGKLIPQFAMSTLIEFIHRVDAAVETVLIVALAACCLYLYRERREMRIMVALMVGFLFLQAGLGAWAVMQPQASAVLALHFGVSLTAFAIVVLTTVLIYQYSGAGSLRSRGVPPAYSRFVWLLAAYTYVVVYSGAYARHTNADDACKGWPLCNGSVVPDMVGKVGIMFGHRVAAGVLTLSVIGLVLWSRRLRNQRPDLYRGSHFVFGFTVLQALAGAIVVWTNMDLFSALMHAATVGLMFSALAYLCLQVLPPARERARAPSLSPLPAGDVAGAHR